MLITIILARNLVAQSRVSGDRDHEKRLDMKRISKIELLGFANESDVEESDVEYERKKLRITRSFFGPHNWNSVTGMGNCGKVKFVGAKLSSSWGQVKFEPSLRPKVDAKYKSVYISPGIQRSHLE